MIVKPSISWLTTDSDPLLINDVSVVLLGMANNIDIYATPAPTLAVVGTAHTNFIAGVAAAAEGGRPATAAKYNLRLILTGLVRQLASYVAVACQGNMENLLLSGFPIQKPTRQPVGLLPAPTNAMLYHGMVSGSLSTSVSPVFGASTYNWRLTAATPGAVPILGQSTAGNFLFTGLTPGVSYQLEANAVGAAGTSDWSNPASMIAN